MFDAVFDGATKPYLGSCEMRGAVGGAMATGGLMGLPGRTRLRGVAQT